MKTSSFLCSNRPAATRWAIFFFVMVTTTNLAAGNETNAPSPAADEVVRQLAARSANWVKPPGAVKTLEYDFLLGSELIPVKVTHGERRPGSVWMGATLVGGFGQLMQSPGRFTIEVKHDTGARAPSRWLLDQGTTKTTFALKWATESRIRGAGTSRVVLAKRRSRSTPGASFPSPSRRARNHSLFRMARDQSRPVGTGAGRRAGALGSLPDAFCLAWKLALALAQGGVDWSRRHGHSDEHQERPGRWKGRVVCLDRRRAAVDRGGGDASVDARPQPSLARRSRDAHRLEAVVRNALLHVPHRWRGRSRILHPATGPVGQYSKLCTTALAR